MTDVLDDTEVAQPDETEAPEPDAEPDETPDDETADEPDEPDEPTPQTRADGRCEAETTVGGTLYRCALQEDHDGEHSFTPLDADDEPEPAPDADLDARLTKLSKRSQTYSKAVNEIMGEDLAGLIPCELCGDHWPGLRPPVPLTAEVAAKLRVALGEPADDNYVQDPQSEACTTCHGLGRVLTGSHVEKWRRIECPTCHGVGFRTSRAEVAEQAQAAPVPASPLDAPEQEEPPPDTDPWGRPKGHPDYFRMPGYETAS